jgi:cystathionine beta-synthase
VIDTFIKVTDKDGAIMARKLSREEGMFVGWSSGSAVHGALEYARENMKKDDMMVILLPTMAHVTLQKFTTISG